MRVRSVIVAAALLSAGRGGVAAQASAWVFDRADVTIDLTAEAGAAHVSIVYDLEWSDPDSSPGPIDVALLGLGDITVREIEVNGDPIVLWPASGSRRAAALPAPTETDATSARISIEYRVADAIEVDGVSARVRVPLVTGPVPKGDARGLGLVVRLPDGWRINDSFPSQLRGGAGALDAELSVVPAYLRMVARTDGRWEPGLPLVLDILTLLILGSFAFAGWRHLRGVVEARA